MYEILAIGYEWMTELIPFFLILRLFRHQTGKYTSPLSKWHYILPTVFALYIVMVFYVTNPGTIYDVVKLSPERLMNQVNLIPFSNKIDVIGYLLNVVMFMPLGFLIPLIWKQLAKPSCILLNGFAFSLLIELSQLLSGRGTDVDDLILNTLGATVGFAIYKIWCRLTKNKYQLDAIGAMELPTYILTLFLGRFLLFHRLGLINLIYGY